MYSHRSRRWLAGAYLSSTDSVCGGVQASKACLALFVCPNTRTANFVGLTAATNAAVGQSVPRYDFYGQHAESSVKIRCP